MEHKGTTDRSTLKKKKDLEILTDLMMAEASGEVLVYFNSCLQTLMPNENEKFQKHLFDYDALGCQHWLVTWHFHRLDGHNLCLPSPSGQSMCHAY